MRRPLAALLAAVVAVVGFGGSSHLAAQTFPQDRPSGALAAAAPSPAAIAAPAAAQGLQAAVRLSSSWSCTVHQAYKNPKATDADCWTNTPPGTRGYVAARQTCATATSQYTQYGSVAVASFWNGWTGVSTTPNCPGYVIARWASTDYVPTWRYP